MPRVKLNPQTIRQEFSDLASQLSNGMKTLRDARDVQLGASERQAVFQVDKVVLYRYKARHRAPLSTPVLVVYALVNRPDMADLQVGRSLIGALLDRGLDVYLIDWGYPDGGDRALTLDDYIAHYIDSCVDFMAQAHATNSINLLGICQGGTFSICYAALEPRKVRNLVTTVTPVDFHTPQDMLSHLFRHVDADLIVGAYGNVPGDLLNSVFLSLKPFRLAQQKYLHLVDDLDDPAAVEMFLRMEKWIFDSPALSGAAFREFLTGFYQGNGLIKGEVRIGERRVDLGAVDMPVLNIYAEKDHLVPPAASLALGKYVGTKDYAAKGFSGGHIGLYVGTSGQAQVPDLIHSWLAER